MKRFISKNTISIDKLLEQIYEILKTIITTRNVLLTEQVYIPPAFNNLRTTHTLTLSSWIDWQADKSLTPLAIKDLIQCDLVRVEGEALGSLCLQSEPITIILFCKQPITISHLCKQREPFCVSLSYNADWFVLSHITWDYSPNSRPVDRNC